MTEIKQCDISQIELLHNVAIQTYKQTYTYLWSDGAAAYLIRVYGKDDLKKDLTTPGVTFFLVYNNGEIAGYFKINENALPPYTKSQCIEIEKLYLLDKFTGKGIGKVIMHFIADLSINKQHSVIWLKVMESSPAKLFYEAFGFKQTNRTYLDYPYMIDKYRWLLTYVLQPID